jgi:4-alpha-glucanotransferase
VELVSAAGGARRARRELADRIGLACFAQFLLFRQAERLKAYAHSAGLKLIGDLPFFVSPDSSDVWANPELFLLDERRRPRSSPACRLTISAPRGSSGAIRFTTGTLFASRLSLVDNRLRALLSHVDVIRLDHFRGFTAAWHVPAGAPTAQSGTWGRVPAPEFFSAVSGSWARYRSSPKIWGW